MYSWIAAGNSSYGNSSISADKEEDLHTLQTLVGRGELTGSLENNKTESNKLLRPHRCTDKEIYATVTKP